MFGTKPDATATAEHLATNGTVNRPRIARSVRFGKGDADLHRPAGMHRIQVAKQRLPHRHHIDKVIKNFAQLFLIAHFIEALGVTFAV